jgi:hypothetical protein
MSLHPGRMQVLEKISIPVNLDERAALIEASNTCARSACSRRQLRMHPAGIRAVWSSLLSDLFTSTMQSAQQQGGVAVLLPAVAHGSGLREEGPRPGAAKAVSF